LDQVSSHALLLESTSNQGSNAVFPCLKTGLQLMNALTQQLWHWVHHGASYAPTQVNYMFKTLLHQVAHRTYVVIAIWLFFLQYEEHHSKLNQFHRFVPDLEMILAGVQSDFHSSEHAELNCPFSSHFPSPLSDPLEAEEGIIENYRQLESSFQQLHTYRRQSLQNTGTENTLFQLPLEELTKITKSLGELQGLLDRLELILKFPLELDEFHLYLDSIQSDPLHALRKNSWCETWLDDLFPANQEIGRTQARVFWSTLQLPAVVTFQRFILSLGRYLVTHHQGTDFQMIWRSLIATTFPLMGLLQSRDLGLPDLITLDSLLQALGPLELSDWMLWHLLGWIHAVEPMEKQLYTQLDAMEICQSNSTLLHYVRQVMISLRHCLHYTPFVHTHILKISKRIYASIVADPLISWAPAPWNPVAVELIYCIQSIGTWITGRSPIKLPHSAKECRMRAAQLHACLAACVARLGTE
jgi:hypothetical protein